MSNTNYQIGDFLIRIKNAAMANKKEIIVKKSNFIEVMSDLLKEVGVLREVEKDAKNGVLILRLAYAKKQPFLTDIKIVSKPGLRIYETVDELKKHRRPSTLIVSTPKGVLSLKDAIKKNVGGEVLAEIY